MFAFSSKIVNLHLAKSRILSIHAPRSLPQFFRFAFADLAEHPISQSGGTAIDAGIDGSESGWRGRERSTVGQGQACRLGRDDSCQILCDMVKVWVCAFEKRTLSWAHALRSFPQIHCFLCSFDLFLVSILLRIPTQN